MMSPSNIRYYHTDDWQSYRAEFKAGNRKVGKRLYFHSWIVFVL